MEIVFTTIDCGLHRFGVARYTVECVVEGLVAQEFLAWQEK